MAYRLLIALYFFGFFSLAQQKQLADDNLNDFEIQDGNWQVVGEVFMDRNISPYFPVPVELGKYKKRKKGNRSPEVRETITFKEGKGIVLNKDAAAKRSMLVTKWEHGDIKLEMEVMVAKGSHSGILLQGKYKIQIMDSWGVQNPKYSDFGGIYTNFETEKDSNFNGVPPLSNSAKAPGLWQHLKIHFKAPKFDMYGKKTTNAKFVSIDLNGVRIHTNVELGQITGEAISNLESTKGPLIFEVNHGPIAFRNINYSLLEDSEVTVNDWSYKVYKGKFNGLDEIQNCSIAFKGKTNQIDVHLTNEEDDYAIVSEATIEIPKYDGYNFTVPFTGGIELSIDGKSVLKNNSVEDEGQLRNTINLEKGSHKMVLTNVKSAPWRAARLGLIIGTESSNPKAFHRYESCPPISNEGPPILLNIGSEPRLLRGFVDFYNEDKKERQSHTIGVGTAQGIHYVYNLATANVIGVWRGEFLDATPMWRSRGDGSFIPNGAVQWTFLDQPIAVLENTGTAFASKTKLPDFVPLGYSIDSENGLPIFKHSYKGVKIENNIKPNPQNTHLIHEISFSETELVNWRYKLAEGEINQMPDGSFDINDQSYYINILSPQVPEIREIEGVKELLVPVNGSKIKYEIIW